MRGSVNWTVERNHSLIDVPLPPNLPPERIAASFSLLPPLQQLPQLPPTPSGPSKQSTDLAHLAGVAAVNTGTTTTTPMTAAAASLDNEAAAATRSASRYAGSDGGRGWASGSIPVENHPAHLRPSGSPSKWGSHPGAWPPHGAHAPCAEGSRVLDHGSYLGEASSTESSGVNQDGWMGGGGAPPAGRRLLRPAHEVPYHWQFPSAPTPKRATRISHPAAGVGGVGIDEPPAPPRPAQASAGFQISASSRAAPSSLLSASGGGRCRGADSPPSMLEQQPHRGGVLSSTFQERERRSLGTDAALASLGARGRHLLSRTASPSAAEAAGAMTSLSPPLSWLLGSGGQGGGESRPGQQGGGPAPLVLGASPWQQGEGDRSGGTGTHAGRDVYDDDRLLPRGLPLRGQFPGQLSRPQGPPRRDHLSQLRSILTPADTAIENPAVGRGGSDPCLYTADFRPWFSSMLDPVRPPFPSAGLAGVDPSSGQAPWVRKTFTFGGEQRDSPGSILGGGGGDGAVGAVGASAGAAAVEWGHSKHRR